MKVYHHMISRKYSAFWKARLQVHTYYVTYNYDLQHVFHLYNV